MTVSGSNAIINVTPSTMYIVQVAAINDAGDGVYSDPLTASTNDSTEHSTVYVGDTAAISTAVHITPALIGGLTVALVLILSITAALTVTVLVKICRGGYSAKRCGLIICEVIVLVDTMYHVGMAMYHMQAWETMPKPRAHA